MGSSRHTSENLPCFTPMLVAKSIGLADENPTMKMRTKTCFIFFKRFEMHTENRTLACFYTKLKFASS